MNSIAAYQKAIKAKFEIEKSGNNADFFTNPSPAKIKRLTLLKFETNTNAVDEGIFNRFFVFKEGMDNITQIKNCDTDRFRPFRNFLLKNTDCSQLDSLNLMAVLVDFHPRPYLKFRNTNGDVKVNFVEELQEEELNSGTGNFTKSDSQKHAEGFVVTKRFSFKEQLVIGLGSLLLLALLGFGVKRIYYPDNNGMIWVKDHYEAVVYENVTDKKAVKPINQFVLEHFRKIKICDTTTFFKNGLKSQPLVWYAKNPQTGAYDFFNQPGVHPITEETLKKITPYIKKKYCPKSCL